MIEPTQKRLLDSLAELCERSPGVRFGQLLSHLGFLAQDQGRPGLGDVEDRDLLDVMESHLDELSRRCPGIGEPADGPERRIWSSAMVG